MVNRLADAASTYLQQHAHNPVDWFPWGSEAFDQAQRRNVPIFLSIGYSTCHWCHVMAHESFADEYTAAILNEWFVSIKVDCEERPDINATYMRAVQAMTSRGGWPMSVFLTPEGRPFYAGSYWPKKPRLGMPSFEQVLVAASNAWQHKRAEVTASADQIFSALSRGTQRLGRAEAVDLTAADDAARLTLSKAWDQQHAGFGPAPKFPHPMTIEWLLHRHARTGDRDALNASIHALQAMAQGGIHDQLGGGFSRYTVDERWLWPHFEKMLYDNALLLPAYAAASALTGRKDLSDVARSTAHYLLTDLRTEHGVFASATDADAAGIEGAYYTWVYDELVAALSDADVDPRPWTAYLGACPAGNWNGTNVLHQAISADQMAEQLKMTQEAWDIEWNRLRGRLLARRVNRVPPQTEHRVLTDWNALTVRGLVRAGTLIDEPRWIRAAADSANFLHEHLFVSARLQHCWKNGHATVDGFLLDHAALALADLELFQATGDPTWFDRGLGLAAEAHERFHDRDRGWVQVGHNADALFAAQKEAGDTATPAGSSVMVEVCLVLAGLTGDDTWQQRAEQGIRLLQDDARRSPLHYGWLLRQLEALAAGPQEIAIIGHPGPDREALTRTAVGRPRPGTVTVTAPPDPNGTVPLLTGRGKIDGRPAAYVCRNLTCKQPVTAAADLAALLEP